MTTFFINETGVHVLDSNGWREPMQGECITTDNGQNFIQVNAEGYYSGLFQGFAAGVLLALIMLGVYAGAVS